VYKILKNGKFVVYNYNWKKPFSNFLPGIAGKFGVPSWCYYVSRNQGVISFGIKDKNHQIMEFLSFNKALEYVGLQGFRTFIKINEKIYEPFRKLKSIKIVQKMTVSSHELEIEEINKELELKINVVYFSLVKQFFPALIRILRIENLSSTERSIEVIDGLPKIYPYGIDMNTINVISRHIEGMMNVVRISGIPIYRLKQTPQDIEKIGKVAGGNFYLSFDDVSNIKHSNYIYDPEIVFKEQSIYDFPWKFKEKINLKNQINTNRTPAALTYKKTKLKNNYTLYSAIGFTEKDDNTGKIIKQFLKKNFIEQMRTENKKVIDSVKSCCLTFCRDSKLKNFSEQMFLDNVIRGGMPVVFNTRKNKTAFYLYSRQNGDLERDYHFFVLEPNYYSQGTGHYRSVNQNRRCDTWFFPEVEDRNIITFMNLIQLDGYNPLEVTQLTYTLEDRRKFRSYFSKFLNQKQISELEKSLTTSFTPGIFLRKIEEFQVFKKKDYDKLLEIVLSLSEENECGDIHEGYWVDHFFYNLDLIDTFLMIYPDRIKELFFGNNDYYFYDNPDVVKPRDEKFVYISGSSDSRTGKVRQYNAVYRDERKVDMINKRNINPKRMRKNYGKGGVYYTNLFVKLLVILVNRMASFDPFCRGLEMEADKPGWNDSMNGLPGLIGSSLCETIELEKLIRIMLLAVARGGEKDIKIFEELYNFMFRLKNLIKKRLNSKSKNKNFIYWDKSHTIKEDYRKKTIFGIRGKEKKVSFKEIRSFIESCNEFIQRIVLKENRNKIFNKEGIPYTYFVNEVKEFEFIKDKKRNKKLSASGYPLVRAKKFIQKPLPLFLEGAVHMLKVHPEMKEKIYNGVKKSKLYDKKLKMYKVCESLKDAPFEIGRVKAWGPGWIENESIYTHMEYKYILEVIKSGLYEEFYKDIKTMFTCYMKSEVYGRNPFENVSFIVSSAFPDKKMHGQGLQPRLSGVTGEMVNIWVLMVAGKEVFFVKNGKLNFKLEPILSRELFLKKEREFSYIDIDEKTKKIKLEKGDFAFKLFGKILVIYKNKQMKDTFGENKAKPRKYKLFYKDGKIIEVEYPYISEPFSKDVRNCKILKMEVELI